MILKHIKPSLPRTLDQHQYAHRPNNSTEHDAIAVPLHITLAHLEQWGIYMRMLFLEYSAAFNTIVPSRLVSKLLELSLSNALCMWINYFLTNRLRRFRLGHHLISNAPQGCVLSPLLYSLWWHNRGGADLRWGRDSIQKWSLQTVRGAQKTTHDWKPKKLRYLSRLQETMRRPFFT